MECHSCNVINKYNTSLSISNINISEVNTEVTKNFGYSIFKDSLLITSEKKINGIKSKDNITVDNFIFRVIESDNSGFMNSDLIDGILSLSYSNISQIPNTNFIIDQMTQGDENPNINYDNSNKNPLGNTLENPISGEIHERNYFQGLPENGDLITSKTVPCNIPLDGYLPQNWTRNKE